MSALYRLYDKDGALLYVGVSLSVFRRLSEHAQGKEWWSQVRRIMLEPHASREAALAAEILAIRDEGPIYNIAGRPDHDFDEPVMALPLDLDRLAPADLRWIGYPGAALYGAAGFAAAYLSAGGGGVDQLRLGGEFWLLGQIVMVGSIMMNAAVIIYAVQQLWYRLPSPSRLWCAVTGRAVTA